MTQNRDPASEGPTPNHAPGGKFAKGNRANPGGRPKVYAEAQALLDAGCCDAARRMLELTRHEDPKVALAATKDIIDRTVGKAKESVELKASGNVLFASLLAELAMLRQRLDEQERDDDSEP